MATVKLACYLFTEVSKLSHFRETFIRLVTASRQTQFCFNILFIERSVLSVCIFRRIYPGYLRSLCKVCRSHWSAGHLTNSIKVLMINLNLHKIKCIFQQVTRGWTVKKFDTRTDRESILNKQWWFTLINKPNPLLLREMVLLTF